MSRYSPSEIIKRAVLAFWQHGYVGSSVKVLEESTGLHVGSLYYHFKNKDHLYAESIRFYLTEMLLPKLNAVDSLETLQHFFHAVYKERPFDVKSACLLIQAAAEIAGHTEANGAFRQEMQVLESVFEEKAKKIFPHCADAYTLLIDLYIALCLYSRQDLSRSELYNKVKHRFELIKQLCDKC